jgi:hypothetical protein
MSKDKKACDTAAQSKCPRLGKSHWRGFDGGHCEALFRETDTIAALAIGGGMRAPAAGGEPRRPGCRASRAWRTPLMFSYIRT